ncbi:MAG: integrase arm-type DNA-binding domain-containing protein, partial [Acidobacteria bacterium]|nr:integrase arm-type DNA-binding domain-containing protein [Acidobacteriota bacterium]
MTAGYRSQQRKSSRLQSLTAAEVKYAGPGKHYDAHGLFLKVEPGGARRWVQRIVIRGRRRDIGLGGWPLVTLAEAREQAFDNRKLARAGGDPLALRKSAVPTFAEAAESVIAINEPTWKDGARSAEIWRSSLAAYAMPRLGRLPVSDVGTADVMAVLLPIWNEKRETARRVRQRIGAVMKWAVAQGFRQDNPAGDAIGAALPKANGVQKHFRALHHADVAAALAKVRASRAAVTTRLAFEFLVLTAARSGEVRLATWDEIDLGAA